MFFPKRPKHRMWILLFLQEIYQPRSVVLRNIAEQPECGGDEVSGFGMKLMKHRSRLNVLMSRVFDKN